jgi:hypothetical protein
MEITFSLRWADYLQVSPKIKDTNLLTLFSKLLNGVIHKYQVSFRTVKKNFLIIPRVMQRLFTLFLVHLVVEIRVLFWRV